MPNYQPINRERHASKSWVRNTSFAFTATEGTVPLGWNELAQAQHGIPIVFLAVEEGYMPFGLLGLHPGKNLFVANTGEWVASYMPIAYRNYPFVLANSRDGKPVLCVDEESSLISELGGEPFFKSDGTPSDALAEVIKQLSEAYGAREQTRSICAVLTKHQLIQPFALKVQGDTGVQDVAGLFRIDEAVLNSLPTEAFMELREKGALLMAYCQLLSLQHLQTTLPQLAAIHQKASAPLPTKNGELDLSFLENKDTLSFS